MTDGPTAIQVSPIPEDEMRQVHSIIQRAFDGVIAMSQLSADVDMLRQTVAGLQADMDRLRSQNNALEEALDHSRRTRNELSDKLATVTHELEEAKGVRDYADKANITIQNLLGELRAKLETTERARDDAELEAMQAADDLVVAKAQLAKLLEAYKTVFEAMKPAEPPNPDYPSVTRPSLGEPDYYSHP
jgi:chromosome segregation ATPase